MTINSNIGELIRLIRAGQLTEKEKAAAYKELEKELQRIQKQVQRKNLKQPKSKHTITVTDENGKQYSQSISKIKSGKLTAKERADLLSSIARKMGIESLQEIDTLDLDFDFEGITADFPEIELAELEDIGADFEPLDIDFNL